MSPITVFPAAEVPAGTELVAVPVFKGPRVPDGAGVADLDLAFLERQGFEAKAGEVAVMGSQDGTAVAAVGVGEADEVSLETLREAAAGVVKAAWKTTTVATTLLDACPGGFDRQAAAAALAEGVGMAAYRFGAYKSDPSPCRLERLAVVGGGGDQLSRALERGGRVAAAVCLARDLVNEPACALTPSRLAVVATEIAEREGLQVNVLDELAIDEERLGGLAGVARGSA
ncbi:MAG: hypothetical protein M3378_11295, partial [Actinomycetota bacterium]|nr:hypothetical protein [Actinomycetota bacterium]